MAAGENLRLGVSDTGSSATSASFDPWDLPKYPSDPLSKAGDFFGIGSAARQANYNAAMNLWLENTAIRRRMYDLRAAGLNPVLAATNSAAGDHSPSTSGSKQSNFLDFFKGAIQTAGVVALLYKIITAAAKSAA